MHQHLELSASGRTVVTTGCAGYGGVMALAHADTKARARGKAKGKAKGTAISGDSAAAVVQRHVAGRKGGGEGEGEGGGAWHVECVAVGVGGFAVGVAEAGAKGPYKSWGRRSDSSLSRSASARPR